MAALDVLETLLALARKAGAEASDALMLDATHLSASLRLGKLEHLERSEASDIGLRVFIGKKQAIVSSTDHSPSAMQNLAERAVSMARSAPEDPFCGLADAAELAKAHPVIESVDTVEYDTDHLIDCARKAEDAARAVPGITNSDGAGAGWSRSIVTLAASNGFSGTTRRTRYSLSATVLAGQGTDMQRDYEGASRVFAADLPSPEWIGHRAGERTVAKMNPRKMPTGQVPVFFDPRISGGLLGHFLGAISGASVARGTSFLKDRLNTKVFPEQITVIDDPHRARGLRSRVFDVEGVLPHRRNLVDQGVLTTWLLDLRSARQLGLHSTGHAARSAGGTPFPSPTNVFMEAGELSPGALMQDVPEGFYVTETMGMGVNGVTGDFSQAASGFWIKNGKVAFPVNEMTIAGNLKDMFFHMTAANDLEFRYGIDAPTLRIDGMTVAGV